MDESPLLNRVQRHVLGLVLAPAFAVVCMLACGLLGGAVGIKGRGFFLVITFTGGLGWMMGGLVANRKHSESGPLFLMIGVLLVVGGLLVSGGHSALHGLGEFHSACLGAGFASWFLLRRYEVARRRTVALAFLAIVSCTVFILQVRPPGQLRRLLNENGSSELIAIAHPLDDEWARAFPGRPMSLRGEVLYVWRSGSHGCNPDAQTELLFSDPPMSGHNYRVERLTDASEIDEAYDALWRTEEWRLDRLVPNGKLLPFVSYLTKLRGDWRRGSVWRAERANYGDVFDLIEEREQRSVESAIADR